MKDELEKNIKENIEKVAKALATSIDEFETHKMLLFDENALLELFLDSYFRAVEGWLCSHDKTCYCINQMKKSIDKKEHLSLQENYKDEDKLAYWCPKSLYNTKELFELIEAYMSFNVNRLEPILKMSIERMKNND